jgi:hypothetical protein
MKRYHCTGAALLSGAILALAVALIAAPAEAGGGFNQPTRVERAQFSRSETIEVSGVISLDHPIFLAEGVTLTLIGDEIRIGGNVRIEGPGTFVVRTAEQAATAGGSPDETLAPQTAKAEPSVASVRQVGGQLRFVLSRPSPVALELFDPQGRRVRQHDLGALPAGDHQLDLAAWGLQRGLYLYRLTSGAERYVGKTLQLN